MKKGSKPHSTGAPSAAASQVEEDDLMKKGSKRIVRRAYVDGSAVVEEDDLMKKGSKQKGRGSGDCNTWS